MKTDSRLEQGEDLDVRRLHGQLVREKSEPQELYRSVPGWLKHGIYAPLLIGGLIYLFSASGGFSWTEYHEGFQSTRNLAEIAREQEADPPSPPTEVVALSPLEQKIASGETVYQAVCLACHQSNGLGVPGAFPPLAGSDWVSGDERRLVLLVLHGLMGPIEVNGQAWNGVMPAQGMSLDDEQIASVLTFVRNAWGNEGPLIDSATVAELRAAYEGSPPWTVETLDAALD